MQLNIDNTQNHVNIDEKTVQELNHAIELCLEEEGFTKECEVFVMFVNNDEIRIANLEQRGKDKPTDVLSFPMLNMKNGKIITKDYDVNPENNLLMLGDIIISTEKAIEQAKEYGHSVRREIMFLLTHGIFHLLGYDHQNKSEETVMINKQEKVLQKMGIGRDS